MASREKIIVSLMVVAVLWGLFALVKGGGWKGRPAAKQNAVSVADLASNDLQSMQSSLASSNVLAYLEKAIEPGAANPFADANLSATMTNSTAGAPAFIYSGHIKAGSREMAIINGQEYFEGEILSTGDYFVEKVLHDRVLLRGKENGETNEVLLVETTIK